jgi:subtilisin family serine protease
VDADLPRHAVIIELNANFPGGEQTARMVLIRGLGLEGAIEGLRSQGWAFVVAPGASAKFGVELPRIAAEHVQLLNSLQTDRFLFARLTKQEIDVIAGARARMPKFDPKTQQEAETKPTNLVYKIWLDEVIRPLVYVSSRTIKCDAARAAFMSAGRDIVWAVADTGVQAHDHFLIHSNLVLPEGIAHRDFTLGDTQAPLAAQEGALRDEDGHGTHVAGIIAGETVSGRKIDDQKTLGAIDIDQPDEASVGQIAGVAPHCKILSLKVLRKGDGDGAAAGDTSSILAAISYIQTLNGYGRRIRVHGLNISLGYDYKPLTFAAGQSPLCVEVDRLVKCGVVVVVAAGNGGGGTVRLDGGGSTRAAHLSTITDPGNAALAITVGSTHRDRPHTYGVSFFSAKGPTVDGRMKPDLVAPGERIVPATASGSCRAGRCRSGGRAAPAWRRPTSPGR